MIKLSMVKGQGAAETIARNQKIAELIRVHYMNDLMGILQSTVMRLRKTTPRSKTVENTETREKWHTGHLGDGWRIHSIGGASKGRPDAKLIATIYNEMTHTPSGKVRAVARCRNQYRKIVHNYSILEVLEYGSRQHIVVPVKKGIRALHFFMGGKEIFATMAAPRGIRPRGFVRDAKEYLRQQLRRFNVMLSNRIKQEMAR